MEDLVDPQQESGAEERGLAPRRQRRYDPHRRERILDATLDVITTRGVSGISHRKVAKVAGVPLGSMTYHFAGIDELIRDAFKSFADHYVECFAAAFEGATTLEQARAAVVTTIVDPPFSDRRFAVLTTEFYAFAAHNEEYRELVNDWTGRCRKIIGRYFDGPTTYAVDGFIQGASVHHHLLPKEHPLSLIEAAIERMTPATSFIFDPAEDGPAT